MWENIKSAQGMVRKKGSGAYDKWEPRFWYINFYDRPLLIKFFSEDPSPISPDLAEHVGEINLQEVLGVHVSKSGQALEIGERLDPEDGNLANDGMLWGSNQEGNDDVFAHQIQVHEEQVGFVLRSYCMLSSKRKSLFSIP